MGKGLGSGKKSSRAWMISFIFLLVITLALAGILAYFLYEKFALFEKRKYSALLRTAGQQGEFEEAYLAARAQRAPANSTEITTFPCVDNCIQRGNCSRNSGPARRRREVDDFSLAMRYVRQSASSSCCTSDPTFSTPTYLTNSVGETKTIYHEGDDGRFQFIVEESCEQRSSCRDCVCQQESHTVPLVIDEDGDLSIDLFNLKSCCKCYYGV